MKTIVIKQISDMVLPHSVRSYIDGFAHEFSEIDSWTKIAHIAYRLKRGVDLLPDFLEDIDRHMEDLAYQNYENMAKQSIASYIELLRINQKYVFTMELAESNSFTKLFQLLTEEILYRYWEENIDGDKVECHFDDVHYSYDEIVSRYVGATTEKHDFIKYISTSQETLRNIEVDKYSIKRKNGWTMVAEKLYGYTIWSDKEEDERIYPGDAPYLYNFNNKAESKYRYVIGVPPMPFSGNLLDAKVVILTLNPGYKEDINKKRCNEMSSAEKEQLLCLMRNALNFQGEGIYDNYDCSRVQGEYYWQKAFKHLAIEAYGIPSEKKSHPIYHDIAFLQLIGHHSEKMKYSVGIKHLPSTIFTNLLVKYLATKTDKTFLVLRSEALWKETFGEALWNKLELEGRIVTKGHKGMSQKISRGNLKKDNGFDKLVNILRTNHHN